MGQTNKKKLEILLGYWIEHNKEHGEEFKEWAGKAKRLFGSGLEKDLLTAASQMDKATKALESALVKLRDN